MAILQKFVAPAFLGFVGMILYVTFPAWSSLFASTPTVFTLDNWQGAHKYRREVMAKDFLDHHPFIGMHQETMIQLLGKPDHQAPGRLSYFVAITAADYMALTFEFDSVGRVSKAYLRQTYTSRGHKLRLFGRSKCVC